jgi:hypothetical protein
LAAAATGMPTIISGPASPATAIRRASALAGGRLVLCICGLAWPDPPLQAKTRRLCAEVAVLPTATVGSGIAYWCHGTWLATASTRSRAVAAGSSIAPASPSSSKRMTRQSSSAGTPTYAISPSDRSMSSRPSSYRATT